MPIAKFKTLRIKIYPTQEQKKTINKFIDTSRYVYNRTLEFINKGHKPNFQSLRDLLVTENTKKGYDEIIASLKQQKIGQGNKDAIDSLSKKLKKCNKTRRDRMKEFDYVKNQHVNPFEIETPKCCETML